MLDYKRVYNFFAQTLSVASVLIVMSAIYQEHDDPGSHYLHPRHAMH